MSTSVAHRRPVGRESHRPRLVRGRVWLHRRALDRRVMAVLEPLKVVITNYPEEQVEELARLLVQPGASPVPRPRDATGPPHVWGNLKAPLRHYDGTFVPVSRRGGNTSMKETPVSRRFTIPLITLAAVVAASCSGAATNSPSAADSRAIDSVPPVAPRAAYKGRIAFDYRRAIWVMKADGSGRRQLTRPGAGNDFDPSWSPDGKKIVFASNRNAKSQGDTNVFIADWIE